MEQNSKETKFIITGFGEFYGVKDNPTKTLIDSLKDHEKKDLSVMHAEVLEVSIQGVDNYIEQIQQLIQNDQSKADNYVFIHFGVDSSSSNFVLEQKGYNQKHFSCPDMKNNKPNKEKISEDLDLDHHLFSSLDLKEIKDTILSQSHTLIDKKDVFKLGENPGRYICNYIYFKSLNCLQCTEKNDGCKIYSLFVHCPPFTKINQEAQKGLVFLLIKSILNSLNKQKEA